MPLFVEISSLSKSYVKQIAKEFSCRKHTVLLDYLKKFAYIHSKEGLFKTYLLKLEDKYIGYISFSPAIVQNSDGSFDKIKDMTNVQSSMNYSIPALKITRLCIVDEMQNKGIGKFMMTFADILAIQTQAKTGCKLELVDAKKDAVRFYEKIGFEVVNKEQNSDTIFMLKKVITSYEISTLDKDKRKKYLDNLNEFCDLFELKDEWEVIKKYYGDSD